MPDNTKTEHLPALAGDQPVALPFQMSPATALWLDDKLFDRARLIASYIAKADGVTPPHLLGKLEACFAVVEMSLTWKLSPSAVARCTYQTPAKSLGFFGSLCQAILENSGKLEGGIEYEHYVAVTLKHGKMPDRTVRSCDREELARLFEEGYNETARGSWSTVQGKFKMATSQGGKPYPVPDYTEKDEAGLGVMVRAQVRGEATKREMPMDLRQCFPRNSTLWATDPMTQIKYTSCRRFATSTMPGIFMGVPFDRDDETGMIDVTPPPPARPAEPTDQEVTAPKAGKGKKAAAEQQPAAATPTFNVTDDEGEVKAYLKAAEAASVFEEIIGRVAKRGVEALTGLWESNATLLTEFREAGRGTTADSLGKVYGEALSAAEAAEAEQKRAAAVAEAERLAGEERERQEEEARRRHAEGETAAKAAAAKKPAAPAAAKAAANDGIVPWTFVHPSWPKAPSSPTRGGGNWIAFLPWFADMIRDMPADQITDFLSAEKYGGEYDALAAKRPADQQEIDDIIAQRKKGG